MMGPTDNGSEQQEEVVAPALRPQRQRAARLPAGERRATILREASIFFAEQGFSASTRDLADRLGVRQALLYKYYPSKEALLESIFESVFSDQLSAGSGNHFGDRNQPLLERLCAFYSTYIRERGGIGVRLFLRAALDHYSLPLRMAQAQRTKLIDPLLQELRHDCGLQSLEQLPMLVGEYELALMLHGAVIFNQIRTHVYQRFPAEHVPDVIRLYIATFLDGARDQLRSLHDNFGKTPLAAVAE
jgi:AcrR family transcriptional regulator